MKLEEQVISLDIAKRLKELGVKQESLFIWIHMEDTGAQLNIKIRDILYDMRSGYDMHEEDGDDRDCSAFTVAELGEMLPVRMVEYCKTTAGWYCAYDHTDFIAPIEADARGKMLISLLENKLITL